MWDRKWLMGLGAAGAGLAILVIGLAPTSAFWLLAYTLYGAAGGPLAHTGDALVLEAYPSAPDRAYTRSVFIDTIGAALAPLLVALVFWLGLPWRWLLVGAGSCALFYAALIVRTGFPRPAAHEKRAAGISLWQALHGNVRQVLASPEVRR